MKLFTIGDSISQGFMSGAAARTDLCFSTLIAGAMGLTPAQYRYPDWPEGGHPVNLERMLRKLNRFFGSDIAGPIEWPLAAIRVADLLDDIEDCYERGPRAARQPLPDGAMYFHNVAMRGFDVADAHLVTPALCNAQIDSGRSGTGDGFFATPSASFYRTALDVLNPSKAERFNQHHALQWLADHCVDKHEATGGVENLLLWLGSNNALGTVLGMRVTETPPTLAQMPATQPERADMSLWHPDVFAAEYDALLDQVDATMATNQAANWRVFVANVPAVSIVPLAKGVGPVTPRPDPFGVLPQAMYYKYYTYFVFDEAAAQRGDVPKLNENAVYQIDSHISRYNAAIKAKIDALNKAHGQPRYVLVDICRVLLEAAYKRNAGQPTYPLPAAVKNLFPTPTTKFYFADTAGQVTDGGLFSLDGVHPSAIGQGIIAHEFMQAMAHAGVAFQQPLDWPAIIQSDTLWSQPIGLMKEVYQHQRLLETVLRFIRKSGRAVRKSGM